MMALNFQIKFVVYSIEAKRGAICGSNKELQRYHNQLIERERKREWSSFILWRSSAASDRQT